MGLVFINTFLSAPEKASETDAVRKHFESSNNMYERLVKGLRNRHYIYVTCILSRDSDV